MHVETTSKTVASICNELDAGGLTINRNYQRQPGVWPSQAQSFFIETLLLRYPIPKVTLYEHTDVATRRTTSEVVDGQQRLTSIKAFWDGKIKISGKFEIDEARGATYGQLPPELQQAFVSYSVGIDLLVDTSPADVREIFRRINSYDVPLNYEEQRHSTHQGPFKWFIYYLVRDYADDLVEFGTFTERNLIRMADMKLLAEVCHALGHGIMTTKREHLDSLYERFNESFAEENRWNGWLRDGLALIFSLDGLQGTRIMSRPYSFYSLLLAAIHVQHRVGPLEADSAVPGATGPAPLNTVVVRLSRLEEALDES